MGDPEYTSLKQYKDSVWAFMLEHCRVLPSGKMRIIFDTDSQKNFEKRIWARFQYNYHREDYKAKQEKIIEIRSSFIEIKTSKKEQYRSDKKERRAKQEDIKKQIQAVERFNRLPRWRKKLYIFFYEK